jgi:hypothetical protein
MKFSQFLKFFVVTEVKFSILLFLENYTSFLAFYGSFFKKLMLEMMLEKKEFF